MNEENKHLENRESTQNQQGLSLETGIGAVGGGIVGAAIGNKLVGGKPATAIGAIVGAVAGGSLGNTVGEDIEAFAQKTLETIGQAPGENEIPLHYSWEELAALSQSRSSPK